MSRPSTGIALLASVWLTVGRAQAEVAHLTARFSYERGKVADCPPEWKLKEAIVSGLGYDPFQTAAHLLLSVAMVQTDGSLAELVAEVTLSDDHGRLLGQQRIRSSHGNCRVLASAAALAARLVLEPEAASSHSETTPVAASPPEAPAPVASLAQQASVASRRSARPTPQWIIGAGPLFALGASVSPNGGGAAGAEARWQNVSLGFELRTDVPVSVALGSGAREQTWLFAGGVVPCWRFGDFPLAPCALLFLGGEQSRGFGLERSTTLYAPYLAGGLRGQGEVWIWRTVGLSFAVDGLFPLVRTQTFVSEQPEWKTPWGSLVFWLSGQVRFL